MRRKWIGVVILLLIFGGIYLQVAGGNLVINPEDDSPQSQEKGQKEPEEVPEKRVNDALLKVYSLDQTTRLKLKAGEMIQEKGQAELRLKKVSVEVYKDQAEKKPTAKEETSEEEKKNWELEATLTATRGVYIPKAGRLKFFGPLSLKREGLRVKADTLSWSRQKNRWQGQGNAVIIHNENEMKLSGNEFVSYVDLDRLKVKGDVKLERLNREEVGDEANEKKDKS